MPELNDMGETPASVTQREALERDHDSEWLHKMAEAEDGADVSVGSPSPISLEEFEAKAKILEEEFPVEGDTIFTPDVPEVLEEEKKEEPKPIIPELTADQKQLLKNRVKRMQKKIQKIGKLHTATKVGDIIQMSDRHYAVANDGSFRFVRMLNVPDTGKSTN